MSDVRAYHPETRGEAVVDEEAMPHLRRSGWLLRSEWDENQASAQAAQAKGAKGADEEK